MRVPSRLVLLSLVLAAAPGRLPAEEPKAPASVLIPTLVSVPAAAAPTIDAAALDEAWLAAPAVSVSLGAGPGAGALTLRACRDGDHLVLLCQWPDARCDAPTEQGSAPAAGADTLALRWAERVGDDGEPVGALGADEPALVLANLPSPAHPAPQAVAAAWWFKGVWSAEVRPPLAGEGAGRPRGALQVVIGDGLRAPGLGALTSPWIRLRAGGAPRRATFTDDAVGQEAAGFRATLAGTGKPSSWRVREVEGAGTRALVQEAQEDTGDRFPLALLEGVTARNVDVSVRFQALKGWKDRGAGVVLRVKDEANHYILRANVLEQNVVAYKMQDGMRVDLPPVGHEAEYGARVAMDKEGWHTLRASLVGDRLQAYLDGRLLFDVVDATFADGGLVGLWTKSDSVMAFDDLLVVPLP